MLNYNIKGTGLEITDEIRTYAEKCLEKAEKFLGGETTAHVDIECEFRGQENGPKYRAEYTLQARGQLYRAEGVRETLHLSLDAAMDDLAAELRTSKRTRMRFVRQSAAKAKEYLRGWRKSI